MSITKFKRSFISSQNNKNKKKIIKTEKEKNHLKKLCRQNLDETIHLKLSPRPTSRFYHLLYVHTLAFHFKKENGANNFIKFITH